MVTKKINRRPRIFQGLLNYGTQAGMIAQALRDRGFDAISVTTFDKYYRTTDYVLNPAGSNYISYLASRIKIKIVLFRCFLHYDIFHFYYGRTLFPKQRDLPFYRWFGKKVIFHYLGSDVQLYEESIRKYQVTNMGRLGDAEGKLHDERIKKRLASASIYADLQFVCAPYLSEFVPGASVLPLAIDLSEYEFKPLAISDNEITLMHAPTSRNNKGTEHIVNAVLKLKQEGYAVTLNLVENVSHQALKEHYANCDIFIDQILAGWYGTASIEAMAIGRPTVCFIRKSYFKHIDYGSQIPIVSADPSNIYDVLRDLLKSKQDLPSLGLRSRKYVEDVHDIRVISKQLEQIYLEL